MAYAGRRCRSWGPRRWCRGPWGCGCLDGVDGPGGDVNLSCRYLGLQERRLALPDNKHRPLGTDSCSPSNCNGQLCRYQSASRARMCRRHLSTYPYAIVKLTLPPSIWPRSTSDPTVIFLTTAARSSLPRWRSSSFGKLFSRAVLRRRTISSVGRKTVLAVRFEEAKGFPVVDLPHPVRIAGVPFMMRCISTQQKARRNTAISFTACA